MTVFIDLRFPKSISITSNKACTLQGVKVLMSPPMLTFGYEPSCHPEMGYTLDYLGRCIPVNSLDIPKVISNFKTLIFYVDV